MEQIVHERADADQESSGMTEAKTSVGDRLLKWHSVPNRKTRTKS